MVTKGTNGTIKKRDETAKRCIKAIYEAKGLLTIAAAKSGIGYRTICRYVADYPSVKEAAHEAKEGLLDRAESKLYDAIDKGEAWAIAFFLKTQGKQRGYIERQEISGQDGKPFEIVVKWDGNKNAISAP